MTEWILSRVVLVCAQWHGDTDMPVCYLQRFLSSTHTGCWYACVFRSVIDTELCTCDDNSELITEKACNIVLFWSFSTATELSEWFIVTTRFRVHGTVYHDRCTDRGTDWHTRGIPRWRYVGNYYSAVWCVWCRYNAVSVSPSKILTKDRPLGPDMGLFCWAPFY